MLGISHGYFIIIVIVLFLIASLIMLLSKLGFLTRITFKQVVLPASTIIYAHYMDRYDIINTKVQEVFTDVKEIFKISDVFGMYYDPDQKQPEIV